MLREYPYTHQPSDRLVREQSFSSNRYSSIFPPNRVRARVHSKAGLIRGLSVRSHYGLVYFITTMTFTSNRSGLEGDMRLNYIDIERKFFWLFAVFILALQTSASFVEAESITGKVVAVSDGDTITVMDRGFGRKVRLDGIDAPERKQDYGNRARQFVASRTFGKTVTVSSRGTDKYGRTIGVVSLPDQTILNHDIVGNGFAWWYRRYAPNDHTLERLESEARAARRGLWQQANPLPPWEFRRGLASPVNPLPSGELPIIGNRNSRIYHRPNCDSYLKVSPKNRVVFQDEQSAQRAGYRLARNCS